jgi:hypothetical protein
VRSDGIAGGGGRDSPSEDENPNAIFSRKCCVRRKKIREHKHTCTKERPAQETTHAIDGLRSRRS